MKDEKIILKFLKIFNKNNLSNNKYKIEDIKSAFEREDYNTDDNRIKIIYDSFFKDLKPEDEKDFCSKFNIKKSSIKKVYLTSSLRKNKLVANIWDKRYRLPKLIYKTPDIKSRSNKKYMEIENFKTYELTPCTAYEMAIRNDNVQLLLERYDKIIAMQNDVNYLTHRFLTKENFLTSKEQLVEEYKNMTFEEYEDRIMRKIYLYRKLIEKDYKHFIDIIDRCTEIGMSELTILKEKITDELINKYLIYPTGYIREVHGANKIYSEEILNLKKQKDKKIIDNKSKDEGWQIRFKEIVHDEFIEVQGINITSQEYFVNNIVPNFNRQVNDQEQMHIPINFSLPIEEIVEYIKAIKKKISPLTPLELLETKLKDADDLTALNTNKNKSILNLTRGVKPQNKLADIFYIYDMRKRDHTDDEIIYELYKYYNKKTAINNKTMDKYFDIIKDYIENERYKELITGKVNT